MSNVEKITIGDMKQLDKDINKDTTIKHWKHTVKQFAIKHGLTDMEAIKIANGRTS